MSNQEILTKAIQKAIGGGWKEPNGNTLKVDKDGGLYCFVKYGDDDSSNVRAYGYQFNLERLIFSHDFAKALWGDSPFAWMYWGEPTQTFDGELTEHDVQIDEWTGRPNWMYHLMEMVIADDPIAYLGENM